MPAQKHRVDYRGSCLCWPGDKSYAEQHDISFKEQQPGELHEQGNPLVISFSLDHMFCCGYWDGGMAI
uniref:Uncharacterized protein n=1 Tax=Arundo donax TaxID=35708 RepID=A0A0A9CU10_ARUDO